MDVEVGVDKIVPEAVIVLEHWDLGGGVGGVVIAENSLQSVGVVVSRRLLLVQEVVRLVTQIVLGAELVIAVLLVLMMDIVNTVMTVNTVHTVEAVRGHVHLDPRHQPLASGMRTLALRTRLRPQLMLDHNGLLGGVLGGPGGARVAHGVAALHAVAPLHLGLAPPPEQRLSRPLPPPGVGLQGAHPQHLLARVVQVVVVEAGQVRLGVAPGAVGGAGPGLPGGRGLGDVGGVAGGPPVGVRRLHVVVGEVPQPRHGVAHGAHGAEGVRVIRADSDGAAGEGHGGAGAPAAYGWKGG